METSSSFTCILVQYHLSSARMITATMRSTPDGSSGGCKGGGAVGGQAGTGVRPQNGQGFVTTIRRTMWALKRHSQSTLQQPSRPVTGWPRSHGEHCVCHLHIAADSAHVTRLTFKTSDPTPRKTKHICKFPHANNLKAFNRFLQTR